MVNESGIYESSCASTTCKPSEPGVYPVITCCYTSLCNKIEITTTTTTVSQATYMFGGDAHHHDHVARSGFGKMGLGDTRYYSSAPRSKYLDSTVFSLLLAICLVKAFFLE